MTKSHVGHLAGQKITCLDSKVHLNRGSLCVLEYRVDAILSRVRNCLYNSRTMTRQLASLLDKITSTGIGFSDKTNVKTFPQVFINSVNYIPKGHTYYHGLIIV